MTTRLYRCDQQRYLYLRATGRYRSDRDAAAVTLVASGRLGCETISCKVDTGRALIEASLHPAAGGDGSSACSGDMLLEALVACAEVTLTAVATALQLPVRGGTVRAEGDLDFRGTLAVAPDAPVGFREIRLHFELDADDLSPQAASAADPPDRTVLRDLPDPPQPAADRRARPAAACPAG